MNQEILAKLLSCPQGSRCFVSYLAGRQPTLRAKLEATKADHECYPKRWYCGFMQAIFTNKKGELCFTIFTHTRYDIKNLKGEGNFRTFNDKVGKLLDFQILEEIPDNFWTNKNAAD